MLTGQYDVTQITPRWTADGLLVGTSYDPEFVDDVEPKYQAPATHLSTYDIHTELSTISDEPLVPPIVNDDGTIFPAQVLKVNSLSPDGRYATAYDIFQATGHLIDLQSGETVFTHADCGIIALRWGVDSVLVGGTAITPICAPYLKELDPVTGEVISDRTDPLPDESIYQFLEDVLFTLGEERILAYAFGDDFRAHVALLTPSEHVRLGIHESGVPPIVAPDGAHLLTGINNNWTLTDLSTRVAITITEMTQLPPQVIRFVDADTITYSVDQLEDGTRTLGVATYSIEAGAVIEEATFTLGPTPHRRAFSPDLTYLATIEGDVLNIYTRDGEIVWRSTTTTSGADTSNDATIAWVDDARLQVRLADNAGTMIVDMSDGRMGAYPPPEPGAQLASMSPDGDWWLYLVPEAVEPMFDFRAPRLIAYNPDDKEVVDLFDVSDADHNNRFMLFDPFVWWVAP